LWKSLLGVFQTTQWVTYRILKFSASPESERLAEDIVTPRFSGGAVATSTATGCYMAFTPSPLNRRCGHWLTVPKHGTWLRVTDIHARFLSNAQYDTPISVGRPPRNTPPSVSSRRSMYGSSFSKCLVRNRLSVSVRLFLPCDDLSRRCVHNPQIDTKAQACRSVTV